MNPGCVQSFQSPYDQCLSNCSGSTEGDLVEAGSLSAESIQKQGHCLLTQVNGAVSSLYRLSNKQQQEEKQELLTLLLLDLKAHLFMPFMHSAGVFVVLKQVRKHLLVQAQHVFPICFHVV